MEISAKKIIGFAMVVALVLGMSVAPIATQTAEAATPHMKSAKVKWDLKNNKTVTCKEKIQLLGTKKVKVAVKNLKTTALSNGTKKTTFTVVYNRAKSNFRPTKAQVDKLNAPFAYVPTFAIADYDTGKSLEGYSPLAQELGVNVKKVSDWKYKNYVKRYGAKGKWASLPMKLSVKVAVTYPESYNGLCLGVWMADSKAANSSSSYWSGNKALKSTNYYKKFKSNMHWMRIK